MRNDILADRLTNYADGLVAAAFVFTSGIGATIADTDSICTLVGSASRLMVAVTVIGAAFLFALRWLRRWEAKTPNAGRGRSDSASLDPAALDSSVFGRRLSRPLLLFPEFTGRRGSARLCPIECEPSGSGSARDSGVITLRYPPRPT